MQLMVEGSKVYLRVELVDTVRLDGSKSRKEISLARLVCLSGNHWKVMYVLKDREKVVGYHPQCLESGFGIDSVGLQRSVLQAENIH